MSRNNQPLRPFPQLAGSDHSKGNGEWVLRGGGVGGNGGGMQGWLPAAGEVGPGHRPDLGTIHMQKFPALGC